MLISSLFFSSAACAQPGSIAVSAPWYVQGGTYWHYDDKEEFDGVPIFTALEYHKSARLILGLSLFNNSFGQFSQYAYVGRNFHPSGKFPHIRLKLSAGIAQGYSGEHHNALPIRWGDSWGIGVVPAIGYQREAFGIDLAVLSDSGLLLVAGYQF